MEPTGTSARFLGAVLGITIAAVILTTGWYVIARNRLRSAPAAVILIVSPHTDLPTLNNYEEAMGGRVTSRTYAEPGMRRLVGSFAGGDVYNRLDQSLLVIPRPSREATVVSDAAHITSILNAISEQERYRTFPLIPIAALVGVCLGCFMKPSNILLIVAATIALSAAIAKGLYACPICPVHRLMGVPLEYWGIVLYLAAVSALVLLPGDRRVLLSCGIASAATICYQLILFWGQRDLCLPCTAIACSNGALLAGSLARARITRLTQLRLAHRLAIPLGILGAFATANAVIGTPTTLAGEHPNRVPATRSLRGERPSFIGLTIHRDKEVVGVFSDTCHACVMAKVWLANHPTIPVRIVTLLPVGRKPSNEDEIASQQSRIAAVPKFLFINRDRITSDQPGWSDDVAWQLGFERDVKGFLASRGQIKEIK